MSTRDIDEVDTDGTGLPVDGRALHEPRVPDLNPDDRLPGQYGLDVDALPLGSEPPLSPEEQERFTAQMQQLADDKRARDEALADKREAARAHLPPNVRRILSEIDASIAALASVDLAPVAAASRNIAAIMAGLGSEAEASFVNQTLTADRGLASKLAESACNARSPAYGALGGAWGLLQKYQQDRLVEHTRAVLSELAAMGGEALPDAVAIAAVLEGCGLRSAYAEDFGEAVAKMTRARVSPILAAKDATIAEQAREIAWLRGEKDGLRRTAELRQKVLVAIYSERDAALAEVARLKAEAEAMARRNALLIKAHKAAVYANAKLEMEPMELDLEYAADVIEGNIRTEAWERAVLEYAAREGLA